MGWATIIQDGLTALMMSSRSGRTDLTDMLLSGKNISLDIQSVRVLKADEYYGKQINHCTEHWMVCIVLCC